MKPDCNYLYIYISSYILGSQEFYNDIKRFNIKFDLKKLFKQTSFFSDNDTFNITKEELANEEFNYIKSKNLQCSFYALEIGCFLFNLTIYAYIEDQ